MADVTLDRKLNLVLTVETSKGTAHVHSIPISRAVYEEHFMCIARTHSAFIMNNLHPVVGPRIARLVLLREAKAIGELDNVQKTLLPEIERLTNVMVPGERRWESLPYQVAIQRKLIDEDAADNIISCLVYFTCASAMLAKSDLPTIVDLLRQFWGFATTSLNATEYMNSLPISMPVATTGEKPILPMAVGASSIPT
jgi:hypothetical protein